MPTTLAPRDGRALLEVTTDRRHAEHRVETRDGAIEIVWTAGREAVLLAHDGHGRVAMDLTPSQVFSLLAGLTAVWERTRGQVGT